MDTRTSQCSVSSMARTWESEPWPRALQRRPRIRGCPDRAVPVCTRLRRTGWWGLRLRDCRLSHAFADRGDLNVRQPVDGHAHTREQKTLVVNGACDRQNAASARSCEYAAGNLRAPAGCWCRTPSGGSSPSRGPPPLDPVSKLRTAPRRPNSMLSADARCTMGKSPVAYFPALRSGNACSMRSTMPGHSRLVVRGRTGKSNIISWSMIVNGMRFFSTITARTGAATSDGRASEPLPHPRMPD